MSLFPCQIYRPEAQGLRPDFFKGGRFKCYFSKRLFLHWSLHLYTLYMAHKWRNTPQLANGIGHLTQQFPCVIFLVILMLGSMVGGPIEKLPLKTPWMRMLRKAASSGEHDQLGPGNPGFIVVVRGKVNLYCSALFIYFFSRWWRATIAGGLLVRSWPHYQLVT